MAHRAVIGDGRIGPVAESVDARAVHRSLSWFKSRPGLQPSLASRASAGRPLCKRTPKSDVIPGWSEGPDLRCAIAHRGISRFRVRAIARPGMTNHLKMPVDGACKTLSRLQNLV